MLELNYFLTAQHILINIFNVLFDILNDFELSIEKLLQNNININENQNINGIRM